MNRYPIRAGVLVRRTLRRYLLELGVKFTEEKGWLDSVFYVDCEPEIMETIKKYIARRLG